MATWRLPNGQNKLNPSNGWIKLSSGRENLHPEGYVIKGLRFFGTLPEIQKFWVDNIQQLATIIPKGSTFEGSVFEPGIETSIEDVSQSLQMCYLGTAGTVLNTDTIDVEQIPQNVKDNLCKFTFGGLFGKCEVVHVVDGDTFDVITYIPLVELATTRKSLHGRATQANIVLTYDRRTGFFARITVRAYGYDAIEKDKPDGQLAKELLIQKFQSLGNIIWCQFIEDEKYGRTLAVMYEDAGKTKILNNYLINEGNRIGRRLAYSYLGGTKNQ